MTPDPFDPGRAAAGAVTLLGLPTDLASSYLRGPAQGPAALRAALHSPSGHLSTESGLDLANDPRFVDVGDLELPAGEETDPVAERVSEDGGNPEEDRGQSRAAAEEAGGGREELGQEHREGSVEPADEDPGEVTRRRIEEAAEALLEQGSRVLSVGGDHAVTYPLLRAYARHHEGLTVLHLDAHPDLYHHFEGDRWSHACVFARVLERDLVARLVQVGIRALNTVQRRQAERFGVEVVDFHRLEMHQRRRPGWAPAIQGPVYLSLDLDVLDPAFAPGVSHPEPGGLSTREVIHLIHNLDGPLVGADVVELNPTRDVHDLTARAAAKLVKEIAGRMLE